MGKPTARLDRRRPSVLIMKQCHPDFLYQALLLGVEQQERLLSRLPGKLVKRLFKGKLTVPEAVALQLEIEEGLLHDWRQRYRPDAGVSGELPTPPKQARRKRSAAAPADPKRVTLESIAPSDWTSTAVSPPAAQSTPWIR